MAKSSATYAKQLLRRTKAAQRSQSCSRLYTVIAWLLIQLALIPALEVPSWAIETLVVLLIIGFVTLVLIPGSSKQRRKE